MLGIILMLVSAALIGWIADLVVPGRLPFGWVGSILAGMVGAWLGSTLLGAWDPTFGGLALNPGILGAIVFAFVVRALLGSTRRQRV